MLYRDTLQKKRDKRKVKEIFISNKEIQILLERKKGKEENELIEILARK
jgi:hypothetical protein